MPRASTKAQKPGKAAHEKPRLLCVLLVKFFSTHERFIPAAVEVFNCSLIFISRQLTQILQNARYIATKPISGDHKAFVQQELWTLFRFKIQPATCPLRAATNKQSALSSSPLAFLVMLAQPVIPVVSIHRRYVNTVVKLNHSPS